MAILTNKATGMHVILHLLFLVIQVTKILYETSTSNSSTCNYIMIDNIPLSQKNRQIYLNVGNAKRPLSQNYTLLIYIGP